MPGWLVALGNRPAETPDDEEAGDTCGRRRGAAGHHHSRRLPGPVGRHQARAHRLHGRDAGSRALRGAHRGRRVGARLGHPARPDPGVRHRRDRHRHAGLGGRPLHGRGDPARGRHRRPSPRRRHHVLPDAVPHAPRRDPAVPVPADGVAPAAPDRPAALQRLLRRRGGVVADHAPADGARHRRDDGHRGRADVHRRCRAGPRRPARLPRRRRGEPALPALLLPADDPRPGAPGRGERDRPRVLRRRDGRQDAGARGRGDRPVPRQGPRAARRQRARRPDPRGVRPDPGQPPQPRCPRRPGGRRGPRLQRRDRGGRRGDRRVPPDHRLLPDPRDRVAARRVPALGRGLPPRQGGARRDRQHVLRE